MTSSDGSALVYYGHEDSPPVVLLHSIATRGEIWMPQMGPWAERFQCLTIDLPGHGNSAPTAVDSLEDYAEVVMAQVPFRRFSIVGLSLGGMIAQACALRHPDRVRSIVIADSLARTPPAAAKLWDSRLIRASAEGMNTQTEDTLSRWLTASFRAENPLTTAWIRSLIEGTSLKGYASAIQSIQKLDYEEQLLNIGCPTLVITGSEDPVATPAVASSIASRIPGASLAIIPGAAHLSSVEQPVRFTEIVGKFLSESMSASP